MAETIRVGCCGQRGWNWADIMQDLERQGGLPGVVINPLSVKPSSCGGETAAGTKFYITWECDAYLLVTMSAEEPALIEAFAKVVEYRPFCKYSEGHGLITFEWDKKDPVGRFAELEKEGRSELQKVQ